jgi:hypothetical protein
MGPSCPLVCAGYQEGLLCKKGMSNVSTLQLGDERLRVDTTVMHLAMKMVHAHTTISYTFHTHTYSCVHMHIDMHIDMHVGRHLVQRLAMNMVHQSPFPCIYQHSPTCNNEPLLCRIPPPHLPHAI